MAETKKVKRKKLKLSGIILIIVFILIVYSLVSFIFGLPIKHINILNTNVIKDNTIIEVLGIKDYPSIYKLNIRKMEKSLIENPLISDVKIKRNFFGKLTIDVVENKVLFFNRNLNKIILSDGSTIDNSNQYDHLPMLINYTPDDIYNDLIAGLNKIDYDILMSISEIEYSPSTNKNGESIDNTRFYLRMNDGNAVVMNTVNIKRLNSYNTIYASLSEEKGTIHLDSISDENIYFKPFSVEKQEIEDAKKESEDDSNEGETSN